jgi:hypothetical protein
MGGRDEIDLASQDANVKFHAARTQDLASS